jgi:enoyl-CoA hydratase
MVERMTGDHDRVAHMLSEMGDLVYNMISCEKPVVSAINGVAVGAGVVVGLLADISICAEDARLGDGHIKLGVAAGDHAASARLEDLVTANGAARTNSSAGQASSSSR